MYSSRNTIAIVLACVLGAAACASSPPGGAKQTFPTAEHVHPAAPERDEALERLERMEVALAALVAANEEHAENLEILADAVQTLSERRATQTQTQTQPQARRGPDPDKVYSIAVADSPYIGPADAKITIVVVFEFACPACERARPFVEQLEKELAGESVRIAYKSFVVHPTRATIPAEAGCAAHQQGKFFDLMPLLWEEGFKKRKFDGKPDDTDDVLEIAKQVNSLDMKRFESDMTGSCKTFVQEENKAMRAIGVGGTPTFFVNGRLLTRRTVDEVKRLVAEELVIADRRIAKGTAQADYYDKWIVKRGEKTE